MEEDGANETRRASSHSGSGKLKDSQGDQIFTAMAERTTRQL